MNSFLRSFPEKEVRFDRASNSVNGSDAESVGAALILSSTRGEIHWGSREEDNKKKDIFLSVDHPWLESNRLYLSVQVKSGDANGMIIGNGFRLKSGVVKDLKNNGTTSCAVWVDRETGNGYWAYIHPGTRSGSHDYGVLHKISPATLYDLARCDTRFQPGFNKGGKKVTISCVEENVKKLRVRAKEEYVTYKERSIVSPVLGTIEVTRAGWRHMFRSSRKRSGKQKSLHVIPYLGDILKDQPSAHFISDYDFEDAGDKEIRKVVHILKFSDVKKYNKGVVSNVEVVAKIQEDIRYPKDWKYTACLSQKVARRVVLISAYYK